VAASTVADAGGRSAARLQATLLGPFSVTLGGVAAGPWARPSARRLCELVLVSPGWRIERQVACEVLFPQLEAGAATNALRKALSMAKVALSALGGDAAQLLRADRSRIWAHDGLGLEVDLAVQREALQAALLTPPGLARDERLALALSQQGKLLEDEPHADWAVAPREALEVLRQDARLALARDRARGYGRSTHADVVEAWETCFRTDPTSEEAATALVRAYWASGRHAMATSTYRRCCEALEELGLPVSPAVGEVLGTSSPEMSPGTSRQRAAPGEERRLVSVLFAQLAGPVNAGEGTDPEEIRELVGGALSALVTQVEALGGTVSAVSGTGLVGLFGAPEAHEDDPERALRAAFRCVNATASQGEGLYLRVGIETGEAIVGQMGGGAGTHYGAMGEVVRIAAALQAVARPSSVLVGPATRRATADLFEWGGTEEVFTSEGSQPVLASCLERPKARPRSQAGRRRLAGSAPLVGRAPEVSALGEALRKTTAGNGGVMVLVGEPGLGKTRLVDECRKLFTAWVAAASGRLPLWLEGRAASYASTRPYGLYHQLLCAWLGVAPEESEEVTRDALARAVKATSAGRLDDNQVNLLAQVMGLRPVRGGAALSRFGPEQLQQACFGAVRKLFSGLMAAGPTLLVLEDLHWADPTSLRLTEAISSLTEDGPLLLVLTRRPEPDPGTSALEAALLGNAVPERCRITLAPLAVEAQRDLARAVLGDGTPDEIVEAVTEGVGGNPLFLEERLASLLETRALTKGEDGGWRLDLGAPGQVPEALERLVRARVDRLGPESQKAIVAASVLGQEFSLGSLASVTDLHDSQAAAVAELCSSGLLIELRNFPEPAYRFRHSLIREAIYKGLLRQPRRDLHARAAWGLEATSHGRLEEVAALLGHHYAMAGEVEPAVHYLEVAGDRAASAFANDEAVASYRLALELLGAEGELSTQAVELWLKLGALFWRLGRYGEGRGALQEAAKLVPGGAPLLAARSYRWLGQLEIEDCRDEEALVALDAAEKVLESCSDKDADDWVEAWLDVQLSRSNLHYWRAETGLQAAVLARVRPLVEARAGPRQKADFGIHIAGQRWRSNRFIVDEGIVADVRSARALFLTTGDNPENFHWQTLGFVLLLHGDLTQAEGELEGALAAARRAGDKSLELFCLIFLAWGRLRQSDVAGVKERAVQSVDLVRAQAFPTSGMAMALLSWVAWKEGRFAEAERLGEQALEQWRPTMVRYPFCWICLWPLVAVRLADGRWEGSVVVARELLKPPQMRLPVELEDVLRSAISAWDGGDPGLAAGRLGQALRLAAELNFA
jgi:class 3 adenylate cyclase/tetratricopeptide (TPR) repeat protein